MITLNMIVKDEAHVIARCLQSVRPWIDSWTIVDTGSTDGTQDLVRELMAGIPGELHERAWVNFEVNRNEALHLAIAPVAKRDYVLFIDADEVLAVPPDFAWGPLTADAYYLPVIYGSVRYGRLALVSTLVPWHWVGVVHEHLEAGTGATLNKATLKAPTIFVSHDGARSRDPETYMKDAALLGEALQTDPQNTRNWFYLAQSYRDAASVLVEQGEVGPPKSLDLLDAAIRTYKVRASMGGWAEEVWYSLYQVACLAERRDRPEDEIIAAYWRAFAYRPTRAEPLYQLARYQRERLNRHAPAFVAARYGAGLPRPDDLLFVEDDVYRWRLLDEVGTLGFYVGDLAAGRDAIGTLLNGSSLPAEHRQRVAENLTYY